MKDTKIKDNEDNEDIERDMIDYITKEVSGKFRLILNKIDCITLNGGSIHPRYIDYDLAAILVCPNCSQLGCNKAEPRNDVNDT